MKGITLLTIAFAFIAIIAVSLILSLFSSLFPEVSTNIYCQLYQAASAIIFLTEKPPLPPECGFQPIMQRITIGSDTIPRLSERIADLAINCWEKAQLGVAGSTFVCYEIYFSEVPGSIKEKDVTDFLISKDKCSVLPNNFGDLDGQNYLCGDENKIKWESDITTTTDAPYIIKFDAFLRKLVIK